MLLTLLLGQGVSGGATNYTLSCSAGSYSLSGKSASFVFGRKLTSAAGGYSLTGKSASFVFGRKIVSASGSYSIVGKVASFAYNRKLISATGSYSLSGKSATLAFNRKLTAANGSYSVTGNAATLTYTAWASGTSYMLTCDAGAYDLSGNSASFAYGRVLPSSSGSYSVTGGTATFAYLRKLVALSGEYSVTGGSALLSYSGQTTEEVKPEGGIGHGGKTKKRWIERDGKILIFESAAQVESFVESEKVKPVTEAKKVIITKPVEIIDKQEIKRLSNVYQYKEKLYHADQIGDISRIVAIYKELQQCEEEEIELLLICL